MIKKILSTIPILFILMLQLAQANVLASVDRSQVTEGESLTLTIKLDDMNEQPDLTPLKKDFDIYGTSTSSQTSIINGKSSSEISYIVTLLPKEVGSIEIPALSVGKEKTNSLTITVTKSAAVNGKQTESIFLEASLSAESAYVNTPVLYTLKLYYAEALSNLSMQPLTLQNATVAPFGKNTQYQALHNGKSYNVVEQRFLITPTQAGKLEIPSSVIQAAILQNSPNSFFAVQTTKPVVLKSKALDLTVKPIPQNIDINDWLPADSVTLKDGWSTSSNELTVGEPVTRTIVLTATGIQAASLPNLKFPASSQVNAYPDKPQTKDFIDQNLPAASKVFKIAYIPTQTGVVEFPQVDVRWFDVKTQTTRQEILPAQTFKVLPGKAIAVPAATVSSPSIPEVITKTVVKTVHSQLWLMVAMILLGLWFVTLILLIICLIKLKQKSKEGIKTKPLPESVKSSADKALNEIKKACDSEDLQALNSALIVWACVVFERDFYSVMAVAELVVDDMLSTELKQLNKALYNKQSFTGYQTLYLRLKQYKKTPDTSKSNVFKPLYPQLTQMMPKS